MNDLRELIQSKLSEITDIKVGPPILDSVIEDDTTYFGYELNESFVNSDMDKNYTMRVGLIGRLVRKEKPTEDTLLIVDSALSQIKTKLKELNIKYSYNDVSLGDGFRKIQVSGDVKYNELNKKLIV